MPGKKFLQSIVKLFEGPVPLSRSIIGLARPLKLNFAVRLVLVLITTVFLWSGGAIGFLGVNLGSFDVLSTRPVSAGISPRSLLPGATPADQKKSFKATDKTLSKKAIDKLNNVAARNADSTASNANGTADSPNDSKISTQQFNIKGSADVTAPASPINLRAFPATLTASDRFTVFWDNPTDPSGIAGARYKFDTPPTAPTDGLRVSPVNDPQDATKGLIEDFSTGGRTTRTMYVWLEDGVGNIDEATALSVILRPEGSTEKLLRVAGVDRYETAAKISQKIFPVDHTAGSVVIANGTRLADALAATPLAFRANAPILLSKYDQIPPVSWQELLRVLPTGKTIYIAGGTAVISSNLENYFKAHNFAVKRLAGPTREVTSVKLTEELDKVRATGPTSVYIANSRTLIDALTAGSPAAFQGRGILLTEPGDLTQNLRDYLNNNRTTISEVTLMGGTSAIPSQVSTLLSNAGYVVKRVNGSDRYHTARLVADWFTGGTPASPAGVALVSNEGQVDALAAAVHAAAQYYPIILVKKNAKDFECLNTADYLQDHAASIEGGYVYGGGSVISAGTQSEAEQMISGKLDLACGNI